MSQESTIQKPVSNGFSMSRHALSGAAISVFLAIPWIVWYLMNTVYGIYGIGDNLMDVVLGTAHGIGADAAEALFVVVTRFLIVFGICWAPITALIAFMQRDKSGY